MPSSRLGVKLAQLPHGVLAELAAQLCSDSAALQAAADECIAAHNPLPLWAVERVLLSPDLMPHILGPLKAEDAAAAAVCSQWSAGWKATNEPRRRLKHVPCELPPEIMAESYDLSMAGSPDGRLVVRAGSNMLILDRSMLVLDRLAEDDHNYHGPMVASDDSIYLCTDDAPLTLYCSAYDGTPIVQYQLEGHGFYSPVLAPGGLLFCILWDSEDPKGLNEIIALDAQTLQLRHRFGAGLLNHASHLAVVADELYVCDAANDRLQVFSLTGEHRRSVKGEWKSPDQLCFAKDRLYLIEGVPKEDDEDADGDGDTSIPWPGQGRRILVLSLLGDILQVVTHPTEPMAEFDQICCFDDKLLATYNVYIKSGAGGYHSGVLALQGL